MPIDVAAQESILEVHQFPCLSDNYGFLIRDSATGKCAAIDTPDADEINRQLEIKNWHLTHILNTHWHPDHTGGNEVLKEKWGAEIVGPRGEADKIPSTDYLVGSDDVVALGECVARIIDTPGHTLGHIIYYFADMGMAFVGDTLFALGCGRLFEGSAEQMWQSLKIVRALPEETLVFCAHEYTQSNARFAVTADPENQALLERAHNIDELRAKNIPTVPTTIGIEKATNPFLRADVKSVQEAMAMVGDDPVAVFAKIRIRKDNF